MTAPTARQLAELARVVSQLRAADALRSPRSYIPHKPHARQAQFLSLTCREALYGGAAGGGKSDALLMAALQYVHVPGYRALILRKTFSDLAMPGAIMDRAREWLAGSPAVWNEQRKQFRFPSGAVVQFGYLETPNDRFRYQGSEFQTICFDELTQFEEIPYRYMFSRLRKLAGVDIPIRMRAGTNPGGIGHEWVRRRFIEPASAVDAPVFVPALIADNPSLDAAEYLASLANLDAATRAQLEKGVWVRDSEGLVYHYEDKRNGIDAAPDCPYKVLALDFGATAPTSFNLLGWRDHDPTVYVLRSWKVAKLAPSDAAEQIQKLADEHRIIGLVGDIGGLGKGYQLEFQRRFSTSLEAAEKSDKLGFITLLNGDLERGRIKVVRSECEQLITEWAELPWHESRSKEMGGFDNHCADGVLYGWRKCLAFVERPKVAPANDAEAQRIREEAIEEADVTRAEEEYAAQSEWWAA